MEPIGTFVMDQLLKMQWLSDAVTALLATVGIDAATKLGGSLHFFIYDTAKIVLLLCVMIFVIGYIQSYFPPERSRRLLGRFKGIWANVVGALLGTVTPFCSCSSIPLFIGFTRAGLPLGVTFSFLISSPMVDLGSIVLAIVGGTLIERMHLDDQVAEFVHGSGPTDDEMLSMSRIDRLAYARGETWSTFKKVFPYILIGVAIGTLIHNWIPQEVIEPVLGDGNPFAVVIATLVGAPIYADTFGAIPIAEALVAKGVGIGTVLAFMMSVTTLSIPSLTMLSRVVKPKLLAVFVGVCLIGMTISGYIFNAVQPLLM